MEFALAIRHLWRHRVWLALVAALAIVAAIGVIFRVSIFPPGLKSRSLEYGSATTQILVQPARPAALATATSSSVVAPAQAAVYAALLRSQPIRRQIGESVGLPWRSIGIEGHAGSEEQPDGAQRSAQLVTDRQVASLLFTLEPEVPIISLYAQAPTVTQAQRIVAGAGRALSEYVGNLQTRSEVPSWQRVELVRLGPPEAGNLGSNASAALGAFVALMVFGAGCLLIILVPRLILAVRKAEALEDDFVGIVPDSQLTTRARRVHGSTPGRGRASEHVLDSD